MKRAVALWLAAALLLGLTACQKEVEPTVAPATPSEYIAKDKTEEEQAELKQELVTFWEEPEMEPEKAKEIVNKEDADVTTEEYRQAVYTVNEEKAAQLVEEAFETKTQTAEVKELFSGIAFKFIEGDTFKSAEVAKQLSKRGTYALNQEAGYYWFTFHDRTLAQAAAGIEDGRSLKEYTFVLEWLLADPNVEVLALKD